MPGHTERDFEAAIEAGLTNAGGYEKRHPGAFDEARALFSGDVTGFLKASQPAKWKALEALLGPKTVATVLDGLFKELKIKGHAPRPCATASSATARRCAWLTSGRIPP